MRVKEWHKVVCSLLEGRTHEPDRKVHQSHLEEVDRPDKYVRHPSDNDPPTGDYWLQDFPYQCTTREDWN